MDDDLQVIASTPDPGEARAWGLVLEAVSLPHRVVDRSLEGLPFEDHSGHDDRYCLVVSAEDVDRAHALLDAEREEETQRALARARIVPEVPRASDGRAWAVTLALALVLVLVYLRSPGFDGDISRALRVDGDRILHGEWWRLVGGAFLHADIGHLAGNLSFLLPLGYFCVRRFGAGAFLFGFVATAAAGFLASVWWNGAMAGGAEAYRSIGASGGMFGLFGLLVGAAMAEPAPERNPRQRRRELFGAALGLMGLTAFGRVVDDPTDITTMMHVSHRTDVSAHIFGFFAGLGLGAILIRTRRNAVDAGLGFLAALAVVLSLLSACTPTKGAVRTEIIVPDANGAYHLEEATLEGLVDFEHLEGEKLVFNAATRFSIVFDLENNHCSVTGVACESTARKFRDAIVKNPNIPVQPRFWRSGGVSHPMDYDTLNLTTAYFQLSAAQRYFDALGVDPTPTAGPVPVYFYPDTESLKEFGLTQYDNAAYFRLSDGFFLLPMKSLQQIPLSMNRGVLFHEYFHRVFSTRVWGLRPLQSLLVGTEAEQLAVRRLRALDEGLADFFGAVATGDPAFVKQSAPGQTAEERDLSQPHPFKREWYDAKAPLVGDSYDPYPPGTCFATWLWRMRAEFGEDAVIAAWFSIDQTLVNQLGTLDFPTLVSIIVRAFPDRAVPCARASEIFLGQDIAACL